MDFYTLGKIACLEKLGLRLRGVHGTSGAWRRLVPFFEGPLAGALEVNPQAVYAAPASRRMLPAVEQAATKAVAERGGSPTLLSMTIDTERGWVPHGFSLRGRQRAGSELGLGRRAGEAETREYFEELIERGDYLKSRLRQLQGVERQTARRELGSIHRELQEGVGAWRTPEEVKVRGARAIKEGA
jgi:hypothetical protein